MDATHSASETVAPQRRRTSLHYYILTAVITTLGLVAIYFVLEARRRLDVSALPADDLSIFSYLDNRLLGEFTEVPLRGLQGSTHLPLNVARCVALAPRSISLGLKRFNDLKGESKINFGQTLCAGGDPEHVDEFCRRVGNGDIDAASAIAFAQRMRYLQARRLTLRQEWIDVLVSRDWSEAQLDELSSAMRGLVAYPGWPADPREGPLHAWPRIWKEFRQWWSSNHTSLKADPGGPLHLVP